MTLTEFRKKNGWTQPQMAEILNVAVRTIASWDTGKVTPDKRSRKALKELGYEKQRKRIPCFPSEAVGFKMTLYAVMKMITEVQITSGFFKRDIPIPWLTRRVGCIPIFDNMDAAKKEAGEKYKIVLLESKESGI